MIKKLLIPAAALALAAPLSVSAEPVTYTVDDSHTSVLFFVNHLGFSDMQGEFNDVEASLTLDRGNLAASSLSVILKAVSVDMDHDELNYHIRSSDFFDVLKHSTLTFESTSVAPGAGDTAVVTGNMTMLGETREVTLNVRLTGAGKNPITNNNTVAFNATGTLNRSDWGMTYLVPAVGDEVTLRIDAEFIAAQ